MKTIFATATAIALFVSPALAQDASETTTAATASQSDETARAEDKQSQDEAMKSAQGAGMSDVALVDRAFVLQGTNAAGNPVYMIVNPPGVLLGIGAPMTAASGSQNGNAATAKEASSANASTSESASTASNNVEGTDSATNSSTGKSVEAMAGEPAKSGYMATQINPASPNMWDPATVERRMRDMGLDKPSQ